jgi:hypothetical protein
MHPTSVRVSLRGKLKDELGELKVVLNPLSQVLVSHAHDFKVSSLASTVVRGSRATNGLINLRATVSRGYNHWAKLITNRLEDVIHKSL